MDHKKKFGLVMPKKAKTLKMKAKSIFDSDSDEDAPVTKRPKIPQKKINLNSKVKEESLEDPSIYEYDSIYDDMKAKQAESIAPKEKQDSRYINTLLKAADKRKKEYERRVEKKIQVERAKEGDKYKNKEAFVTSAYKKKMLEREEEEERERRETMLNDMMDVTKQSDLSGFYRHFLKQSVGEEKIPIFGEKDIKKEVVSDNEKSGIHTADAESNKDGSTKPNDTNMDRDSDGIEIDSDSDSCKKVSTHESDASSSENGSSHQKLKKINKQKKRLSLSARLKKLNSEKQTKTYRKSAPSSSEFESEEESNQEKTGSSQKAGKHKSRDKQERNRWKGNLVRPSQGTTGDSESDNSLNQDHNLNKKNSNSEKEKKAKPSIYVKRTVGDVFTEAQARYFQRMAIHNGGIS